MGNPTGDFQSLFDGIFGKQKTPVYERPKFELRELSDMLKDLSNIPILHWDRYAFSRDPLDGRVSSVEREKYMQSSWECGVEWADKLIKEYGNLSAEKLANILGMEVEYPLLPESSDRVLFAEFREPNNIRIYLDAINKAKKYLEDTDVKEILGEADISDVLLLHELFHSVEEKHKKEIYTKTEKIRLWSIGPIHYNSGLVALSEIAAMGFAFRYSGIKFSPYLLDLLLIYGYSANEASGLYEEMMELAYDR